MIGLKFSIIKYPKIIKSTPEDINPAGVFKATSIISAIFEVNSG